MVFFFKLWLVRTRAEILVRSLCSTRPAQADERFCAFPCVLLGPSWIGAKFCGCGYGQQFEFYTREHKGASSWSARIPEMRVRVGVFQPSVYAYKLHAAFIEDKTGAHGGMDTREMIDLYSGWLNEGGHDAMVAIPTRDEIRAGVQFVPFITFSRHAPTRAFVLRDKRSEHEQKRDTSGA